MTKATAAKSETRPAAITTNAIVTRVPRPDPNGDLKARKLAGDYRVIHGKVLVSRPTEAFLTPDGMEKPLEAKWDEAIVGDVVRLTDVDAARLLDQSIIEELDAKPSRAGKVFVAPKVVKDFTGMPQGPTFGAHA